MPGTACTIGRGAAEPASDAARSGRSPFPGTTRFAAANMSILPFRQRSQKSMASRQQAADSARRKYRAKVPFREAENKSDFKSGMKSRRREMRRLRRTYGTLQEPMTSQRR